MNRGTILEIIRNSSPQFVSGEYLSARLGITRAAVWKMMQALRGEGFAIEARPRKGYRLLSEPDRLPGDKLVALGIHYYKSVESTNAIARTLAEQGCPGKSVIIAEEQLDGRGRRGRSWSSPPGKGLWFSILLRPDRIAPGEISPVTLVTAVALARTLKRETGLPVTIKWPNDLLIRERKICGILTEIKGEPDHIEYLIIGIGINVLQERKDFPPDLRCPPSSLYLESGARTDRTSLFLLLLERLSSSLELFFQQGFAPFRAPWIELNSTLGRMVNLSWPGGGIKGRAIDLDCRGALIVEDNAGIHHYLNYGELQNE